MIPGEYEEKTEESELAKYLVSIERKIRLTKQSYTQSLLPV
jgi:hypothetical protein